MTPAATWVHDGASLDETETAGLAAFALVGPCGALVALFAAAVLDPELRRNR